MKDRSAFDTVHLLRQLADIEPPPDRVQRAVERVREAFTNRLTAGRDATPKVRWYSSKRYMTVAATIASIVLLVAGSVCVLLFTMFGAQGAFAHVQTALAQRTCMAYSVEVVQAPNHVTAKSGTCVVRLATNGGRFESTDGTEVQVTNGTGTSLFLFPLQKRAVVWHNTSAAGQPSFASFLASLRDCDPDTVEQLTDYELDGQAVECYQVCPESYFASGAGMLVYVDPRTYLPVRIEIATDKFGGGLLQIVCKNFSFGECDPALFSVVPPVGYQVENYLQVDPGKPWVRLDPPPPPQEIGEVPGPSD